MSENYRVGRYTQKKQKYSLTPQNNTQMYTKSGNEMPVIKKLEEIE